MIKKINFQLAVNATLTIVALVLIYHLLIITGAIPYEATWGGRLETYEQMIQFESISLALNIFFLLLVATKGGYLKIAVPPVVITALLWVFVAVFTVNTIGNLMATNILEKVIFTPMTALLAIFFWRMAVERNEEAIAT